MLKPSNAALPARASTIYIRTRLSLGSLALAFVSLSGNAAAQTLSKPSLATNPHALISRALDAMGGADRLRAIKALQLSGVVYENHLYETEPPEQPLFVSQQHFSESRDLVNARFRRSAWGADSTRAQITVGSGGLQELRAGTLTRVMRLQADWLPLSPERILFTASDAADLRSIGDTTIADVTAHGIGFTWNHVPVRIWFNSYTDLPIVSEYIESSPGTITLTAWGDVRVRNIYSVWGIIQGGVHYPGQINTEWNGAPYRLTTYDATIASPLPDSAYTMKSSASAGDAYAADKIPLGQAANPATEIEPGVVQIPGLWYTTIIRQSDGLVIIDAPISPEYSVKVLDEAARRYPGVPVKAVITSSNYWWHFAGIREYVARGIPVYGLDRNRKLIETIATSPHTLDPDHLQRSPHALRFHSVGSKVALGSGPNRLELYPVNTSTTSLMMMVYFPEHKLLYSSDMAQPLGPNGSFIYPQYLWDLRRVVRSNGLDVKTLIGMHMSPTPWTKLEDTISGTEK